MELTNTFMPAEYASVTDTLNINLARRVVSAPPGTTRYARGGRRKTPGRGFSAHPRTVPS